MLFLMEPMDEIVMMNLVVCRGAAGRVYASRGFGVSAQLSSAGDRSRRSVQCRMTARARTARAHAGSPTPHRHVALQEFEGKQFTDVAREDAEAATRSEEAKKALQDVEEELKPLTSYMKMVRAGMLFTGLSGPVLGEREGGPFVGGCVDHVRVMEEEGRTL